MNNPVAWFEIPMTDIERARAFYENVFGFELQKNKMEAFDMLMFPMDMDAAGAAGSLIKGDTYEPCTKGTMVYFSVEDIEATLALVEENGGETLMPKMDIGEHGFVAHFKDSEGNRISLHSMS